MSAFLYFILLIGVGSITFCGGILWDSPDKRTLDAAVDDATTSRKASLRANTLLGQAEAHLTDLHHLVALADSGRGPSPFAGEPDAAQTIDDAGDWLRERHVQEQQDRVTA